MFRLVLQKPGSENVKDISVLLTGQNRDLVSLYPLHPNLVFLTQPSVCVQLLETGHNIPLNMTGLTSVTTPWYPVSSLNSLTALSPAVSPSSTSPAGTSMTTLLIGGRNCFWRTNSGPVGLERMATMPTPSMGEFLGRVCRSADSHLRSLPRGSL